MPHFGKAIHHRLELRCKLSDQPYSFIRLNTNSGTDLMISMM
jgi:hypothetical protein